jgi:hypothetical protein
MNRRPLPSQDRVRELFKLDKKHGLLIWKDSNRGHEAGQIAQCKGTRYWLVSIDGVLYAVHRIIWLYVKGTVPNYIDHKNRDSWDNRWVNLREAPNMAFQRANSKGTGNGRKHKGVYKASFGNRWRARGFIDKKSVALGSYETAEEAHKAYVRWLKKNFGEFAHSGESN